MLRKYLKYDLKSVFGLWWIAAVVLLGLSVPAGICIRILVAGLQSPQNRMPWEIFGIILFIMGIGAFVVVSCVLVFLRFFNNFFRDEGYLTFTLPIPRRTLLWSKIINSLIWELATGAVITLSIAIMLLLAPGGDGELNALFPVIREIGKLIVKFVTEADFFAWVSLLISIVIALLLALMGVLVPCMCITIGSVIARRVKLLVGIALLFGFSYASNLVYMIAAYSFSMVGVSISVLYTNPLPGVQGNLFVVALLLLVAVAIAIINLALYNVTVGCIERKLNLS